MHHEMQTSIGLQKRYPAADHPKQGPTLSQLLELVNLPMGLACEVLLPAIETSFKEMTTRRNLVYSENG
jgi:hypothetical protein